MGRKNKNKTNNPKTTLYWIIFTMLSILLIYPPYFRGLFFDKEFLPTHIFSGILFILWIIYKFNDKKDYTFLKTPLDYAALALVLSYFISMFVAVNLRLALGEFLKYLNYFMVYLIVSEIAAHKRDIKTLLNIMLISALGVAVLGIGAAAGTFTYNGAFVGNRINSSIQYPNSLAIYLTAALIISFTLQALAQKQWHKYLYSASNFILFFTIIFTYSRGTWLTMPIVLLLFFLGLPKGKKLTSFLYFIVIIIASAVCIPGFWKAVTSQNSAFVWLWFIIGIALSVIGICPIKYIVKLNKNIKIIAAVVIVAVVITGVIVAFKIEEPLTLEHNPGESDGYKTLLRELKVKPETKYILDVDIDYSNPEDKPWAWRIRVLGIEETGNTQSLLDKNQSSLKENEALEFKTLDTTEKIRIVFYNYYENTRVTYNNANLIEKDNPNNRKHIVLKYKYIPENLVTRLKSIGLEGSSQFGRLTFYKDSIKIFKDFPILGTGGGGWETLFTKYQSFPYWSRETHSQFFQTLVETGIIGFIAFLSIWFTLIFMAYKTFKQEDENNRILSCGLLLAPIALGAHSLIDFNLSLGAIYFYLWQLLSLNKAAYTLNGLDFNKVKSNKKAAYIKYVSIAISIVFIIVSTSLLVGYNYGQKAVRYLTENDVNKAKQAFKKASKFDPLTSSFHYDLSQINKVVGQKNKSKELILEAKTNIKKAIKLDPYNSKAYVRYAEILFLTRRVEEGINNLKKARELYPFNVDYYEHLASVYKDIAKYYIEKDAKDKALTYIQQGLQLKDTITQTASKVPANAPKKFKVSSDLLTYLQQLQYLYDNIDNKAITKNVENIVLYKGLTFDLDKDNIPDLCRIYNNLNVEYRYNDEECIIMLSNHNTNQAFIQRLELKLLPRKTYTLEFEARGAVSDKAFDVYVISQSGTSRQFGKRIKLTKEFQKYQFTIDTTKDIEPGKQILRFNHNGNDKGSIEIKNIVLYKINK